jgi:hypothetical protein
MGTGLLYRALSGSSQTIDHRNSSPEHRSSNMYKKSSAYLRHSELIELDKADQDRRRTRHVNSIRVLLPSYTDKKDEIKHAKLVKEELL